MCQPISQSSLTVIIPALNEAGNIRLLIQEVLATIPAEVVVVDNGSTDETAVEAAYDSVIVVKENRRGYGYACAAGVAAATGDILVFMDGDRSFLPAEIPRLVQPIYDNEADLVLGSRMGSQMETGAMLLHQRFGNWIVACLMKPLYSLDLTDLGPFRAIRRSLLLSLQMEEMTFGWPTEMIVKTACCEGRIQEVPITYRQRRAGQSKVSGTLRGTLLATRFILGVTFRYALRPRSPGLPHLHKTNRTK
jgi:cellulose synthase/poly-beta-1,6-N-acetylglucosamine synthase-like glycosyltransferase